MDGFEQLGRLNGFGERPRCPHLAASRENPAHARPRTPSQREFRTSRMTEFRIELAESLIVWYLHSRHEEIDDDRRPKWTALEREHCLRPRSTATTSCPA